MAIIVLAYRLRRIIQSFDSVCQAADERASNEQPNTSYEDQLVQDELENNRRQHRDDVELVANNRAYPHDEAKTKKHVTEASHG